MVAFVVVFGNLSVSLLLLATSVQAGGNNTAKKSRGPKQAPCSVVPDISGGYASYFDVAATNNFDGSKTLHYAVNYNCFSSAGSDIFGGVMRCQTDQDMWNPLPQCSFGNLPFLQPAGQRRQQTFVGSDGTTTPTPAVFFVPTKPGVRVSRMPPCSMIPDVPGGHMIYVKVTTTATGEGRHYLTYEATYSCENDPEVTQTATCKTSTGMWGPLPQCGSPIDRQAAVVANEGPPFEIFFAPTSMPSIARAAMTTKKANSTTSKTSTNKITATPTNSATTSRRTTPLQTSTSARSSVKTIAALIAKATATSIKTTTPRTTTKTTTATTTTVEGPPEAPCSVPPEVIGGHVIYTKVSRQKNPGGSEFISIDATYICESGEDPLPSDTANCQSDKGEWGPIPDCSGLGIETTTEKANVDDGPPSSCIDPPAVDGASFLYMKLTTSKGSDGTSMVTYTATFACDNGENPLGGNSVSCHSDDGQWGPLPVCANMTDENSGSGSGDDYDASLFGVTETTTAKTTIRITSTSTKPTKSGLGRASSTTAKTTSRSVMTTTKVKVQATPKVTTTTKKQKTPTSSQSTTLGQPTIAVVRNGLRTFFQTTTMVQVTTQQVIDGQFGIWLTTQAARTQEVWSGTLLGAQCRFNLQPPHTLCLDDSEALIRLEKLEIARILAAHNYWRSTVDPPALEMPALQWDDTLATEAERWAAQCPSNQDSRENRDLPFGSVGQNILWSTSNVTVFDAIRTWADERKYWFYGSTNAAKSTAHYGQIISAKTLYVGCAKSECTNDWKYTIVCNYGPAGTPPWVFPYTAASGQQVPPQV